MQTQPIQNRKSNPRGVRYERTDGVIWVSRARALKLIDAGQALRDWRRTQFAIVRRFKQSALGNAKCFEWERWEKYRTGVLIHPESRERICGIGAK